MNCCTCFVCISWISYIFTALQRSCGRPHHTWTSLAWPWSSRHRTSLYKACLQPWNLIVEGPLDMGPHCAGTHGLSPPRLFHLGLHRTVLPPPPLDMGLHIVLGIPRHETPLHRDRPCPPPSRTWDLTVQFQTLISDRLTSSLSFLSPGSATGWVAI